VLVATPAGASSHSGRYQVELGDTLSSIAARLGVSMRSLESLNGIGNPNLVVAGTWLRVPSGGGSSGSGSTESRSYTIRQGENLSTIASRFGLATSTLAAANGISDPNRIRAGERLTIPSISSDGGGSYGGSTSLPLRLREHPSRMAYIPTFDHWASVYGVPADLLKATTWLESGWQQNVVSSTGAIGIGQLEPSTVVTINQSLGTHLSPWNPYQNIRMSARLLSILLMETGGNSGRALAGYYQGLQSVHRNGLYSSTLAYVSGVESLRPRFR
jgi:LysM repeat protein